MGWSTYSDLSTNNPVWETIPQKPPIAPLVVTEETFGTTLAIAVNDLTGALNGGSPIISYHI